MFSKWFSFEDICRAARITRSEPKPENPLEKWRHFVGKEQLWRILCFQTSNRAKRNLWENTALTSGVAPALDSSEKERTQRCQGNISTGKLPSISFSWEMLPTVPCCAFAPPALLGQVHVITSPLQLFIWDKLLQLGSSMSLQRDVEDGLFGGEAKHQIQTLLHEHISKFF